LGVTVSTIAPSLKLTTVTRVKSELGLTSTSDDALLSDIVDRASDAVESYCHRTFAREVVSETLPGYGGIHLQLARTPVITVSSVTQNSSTITSTDYSIADPHKGWLYRRSGWGWTAQTYEGLHSTWAWLDQGFPMPGQEEPNFTAAYTAGFILPSENVTSTAISAAAADNSFNSTGGLFPSLLKSGDVITVSGFAATANNKRWKVTGTPTTTKVVVDGTLSTEAVGASVTIQFQTLPRDVEKAAIETAKAYYLQRKDSGDWIEKQVGAMRLRKSEADVSQLLGIPASAIGLLRPWVRVA
jgi:hypothetical protein